MELQLVSKEVAILAKELWFDWATRDGFNFLEQEQRYVEDREDAPYYINSKLGKHIARPEQELLAKWLRDVHKIHLEYSSELEDENSNKILFFIHIKIYGDRQVSSRSPIEVSIKYEDIIEVGLKMALLFLKEKLQKP